MRNFILSAFMLAGAAIGGGVLALPILAAGPGVMNTLFFITFTYVLAYWIAVISIDVYARYESHEVNAATLATDFFGKKGYVIATVINVLSIGSLAAAYVNAGGDLLVKTVLPHFNIQMRPEVGMILFFAAFFPAFVVGLGLISRLNGLIFTIKFACLAGGILFGLHLINPEIFEFNFQDLKYLGAGASTMFCIWMMHMVLPLALRLNDWCPKKTKLAVIAGLGIPAVAYVGWMFLIFSLVPRAEFLQLETIGDVMHYALYQPQVPKVIATLVGIFASITVLTAFLSIGFSLVAFVIDALKWKNTPRSRLIATIISFTIPVIIAMSFPKAFAIIYQQSNMFQIAACLIPIAAAIKYNKEHKINNLQTWFVMIVGSGIIVSQILDNLKLLPIYN